MWGIQTAFRRNRRGIGMCDGGGRNGGRGGGMRATSSLLTKRDSWSGEIQPRTKKGGTRGSCRGWGTSNGDQWDFNEELGTRSRSQGKWGNAPVSKKREREKRRKAWTLKGGTTFRGKTASESALCMSSGKSR